jgi:Family of unknown function (DUF6682)
VTLNDILTTARAYLNDINQPYIWTDDQLVVCVNKVVDVLAERCFLIEDTLTASVCQITVVANTSIYDVDDHIVRISRAKLASSTRDPLTILREGGVEYMDAQYPTWETYNVDTPTALLTRGIGTNKVRLWPPPDANDTVNMTVFRKPLTLLSKSNLAAVPEIQSKFHWRIFNGVLAEAYSFQDKEGEDLAKANKHYLLFEKDIAAINIEQAKETHAEYTATPPGGAV